MLFRLLYIGGLTFATSDNMFQGITVNGKRGWSSDPILPVPREYIRLTLSGSRLN